MKYIIMIVSITFLLSNIFVISVKGQEHVDCGDVIESEIKEEDEIHEYLIDLTRGMRLFVIARPQNNSYQELYTDIGIIAPNGFVIDELPNYSVYINMNEDGQSYNNQTETQPLSETGTYSILVMGHTGTGGTYTLSVGCMNLEGEITINDYRIGMLQCGSILDNVINYNYEYHVFYIHLSKGDRIDIDIVPTTSSYEILALNVGVYSPTQVTIDDVPNYIDYRSESEEVNTDPLPETGFYQLEVITRSDTGGSYNLSIGCTLSNGTRIQPGDAVPVETSLVQADESSQSHDLSNMASIDLSNAIEIYVEQGEKSSGALSKGSEDVFAYVYEAQEAETITLHVSKQKGDISLGIVVMSKEDNETLFMAGIPARQGLNTQIDFPSSGEYVIAVFRLDTDDAESTNGSFIVIINP